jgi:uncharacterized membrane protein
VTDSGAPAVEQLFGLLGVHWRYVVDVATFVACAALVVVYQLRLARRVRDNPAITVQGMNAQARQAWVERVMHQPELHTMAVQTFRNSTMAASLMASTAVLLIFGILNLMASAEKIGVLLRDINSWGSHEPGMWVFKLIVLIVDFFIAFFSFSLAVRGYNHAGYLVNVPPGDGRQGVSTQKVVQLMDRTSGYYSVGMRAYYFSVPLVLWLFGPVWMLVATVVLLGVLNHLDHLPD